MQLISGKPSVVKSSKIQQTSLQLSVDLSKRTLRVGLALPVAEHWQSALQVDRLLSHIEFFGERSNLSSMGAFRVLRLSVGLVKIALSCAG